MKLIDNRGITDPRENLALEEHVLRTVEGDDSFLLFYVNEPSIIIGRNQNTVEEINAEVVRDRGVRVVRRVSGGGAVYHDLGNLNFSFLAPSPPSASTATPSSLSRWWGFCASSACRPS